MKSPSNVADSVRQRLLNKARSDNRSFNELLQYYAMERFLYRLSCSNSAHRFILKGALLLKVWETSEFRATMDIDMLGKTSNDEADILPIISDILAVTVEEDGMVFDPGSLHAEPITEDAAYEGIRIRFRGALDSAKVVMQIDIGFGDIVYPAPEEAFLPTILDFPAPELYCYTRESAIAEKFEAMVKLGLLNSRMKDFYDIWILSRGFDFTGSDLAEAIRLTFKQRHCPIPETIEAFSPAFVLEKQVQWTAFRKRLGQDYIPSDFEEIVTHLNNFLTPIVATLATNKKFDGKWSAPGPSWKNL